MMSHNRPNFIMVMSLVAVSTSMLVRGNEDDVCGGVTYDETCSTNCSQSASRFDNDIDFFHCSVGTSNDVTEFKDNNKHLYTNSDSNHATKFDAPKMIGVNFYRKRYPLKHQAPDEPSLNITFLLPKGLPNWKNDYDYAVAVLLKFQSVDEQNVRDFFYFDCPRERIFRFLDWQPRTTYDRHFPRNISYDCLVGLNDDHFTRVYLINLESVPGHNVTYTVTVFPMNYSAEDQKWKPAIATSVDVQNRSIYVVFDSAPALYRPKYYKLYLIDAAGKVINTTGQLQNKVTYTFVNIKHGTYRVMVSVHGRGSKCRGLCVNATSYDIDAREIPAVADVDLPIPYGKVVAMVVGCFGGLLLVLVGVWCWRQKCWQTAALSGPRPSGLIIHSHHCDPKLKMVVDKLGHFLENICDASIYIDIWHDNSPSEHQLSLPKSSKLPTDGHRQRLTSPTHDLVEQKLEKVSFVIIVCPPKQTASSSYFKISLEKAVKRSKLKNNLWIIPVCFTYNSTPADVLGIISEKPVCKLMEDIDKIYCKIHCLKTAPEAKQQLLHTSSYVNCKEGRELFDAINDATTIREKSTSTPDKEKLEKSAPDDVQIKHPKPLPDQFKKEILRFNLPSPVEEHGDCELAKVTKEKLPSLDANQRLRHCSEGSPLHRANLGTNKPDKHAFGVDRPLGNRITTNVQRVNSADRAWDVSMPTGSHLEMLPLKEGQIDLEVKGQNNYNNVLQFPDIHPIEDHRRSLMPRDNYHHGNWGHHGDTHSNSSKIKEVGDYMYENLNHHGDDMFRNTGEYGSRNANFICGCDWRNGTYGLCGQCRSRSACASAQADQDLPCPTGHIPQTFSHFHHHGGLDPQHLEHIGPPGHILEQHGSHVCAQSKYMDQRLLTHDSSVDDDLESSPDIPYQTQPDYGHSTTSGCHEIANLHYDHPAYNCKHIYNETSQDKFEVSEEKELLSNNFVAVDPPIKVQDTDSERFDSGIQSGEMDTGKGPNEMLQKQCDMNATQTRSFSFEQLWNNAGREIFYPPEDDDMDMSGGSATSSLMDQMDSINSAQYRPVYHPIKDKDTDSERVDSGIQSGEMDGLLDTAQEFLEIRDMEFPKANCV